MFKIGINSSTYNVTMYMIFHTKKQKTCHKYKYGQAVTRLHVAATVVNHMLLFVIFHHEFSDLKFFIQFSFPEYVYIVTCNDYDRH